MVNQPNLILFAQHGWADDNKQISKLAQTLAPANTQIIAPDLGWFNTWLKIEPLIEQVEKAASATIASYPDVPWRIIGHSMGGLIWLEVLNRNQEWWSRVESFVLIASPVSGADLARLLDPLDIGIGIAKDLGKNRRLIAQSIAKTIPTLTIAGDIDGGGDGTITVESTKFRYATFVYLKNLPHPVMRNHPQVVQAIQDFWLEPRVNIQPEADFATILIESCQQVPGMTDAHRRDFHRAKTYLIFSNGISIRRWKNPLQIEHIFVTDSQGKCLYGGFVGWLHNKDLYRFLKELPQKYSDLDYQFYNR